MRSLKFEVKMKIRELYHAGGIVTDIYEKLSDLKVKSMRSLSDEEYIRRVYEENLGQKLNLENPITYNEKLQWLKLHDHNPMYSTLVDKYAVKKYVSKKIGDRYVIPVLGGPWNDAGEIDFNALPDKFVLKCNHDCGSVLVCTEKKEFDSSDARKRLNQKLKVDYYLRSREWPYKNVKPCIFAEKYMIDDEEKELKDYKFFCFNGKPEYMFIASDRLKQEETKFDFFDMEYNHLPFTNGHPNAESIPKKPKHFEEMKELAARLSEGIPHVRVDFYEANGDVYFGEFTFYHWGGLMRFVPEEWNQKFGELIDLSLVKQNK